MINYDWTKDWSEDWVIYKVRSGSQAYGTALPTSDTDTKGIAIPPSTFYLSFFKKFEQYEQKAPDPDCVIYDFKKFLMMVSECNPNTMELLFVDESDILYINEFGKMLRDNRELFLSAKVRYSFTGYAHSQMARLKNHKNWNDNPPEKPNRSDFNLPEHESLMTHSQIIAIDKEFGFSKDKRPSTDVREAIAKKYGEEKASAYFFEKRYRVAQREYDNHESWKKNRNKERHETEVRFQYDTKHAMHTIRLLRMGKEILEEGEVRVRRPDAQELLDIRLGKWPYEKLQEEAERLDQECREIYEKGTYKVPYQVDVEKIDRLCLEILRKKFLIGD
jgi:predicted nucleotidyltransferase